MWEGFGVISIFLLLPLSLLGQADEHPLPLPADFDPAECASCHSDKQKGKYVHTAIGMGCGTCHQVETQEETTQVILTAAREELCGICHEKGEEQNLHAPYAENQCVVCHDPHTSEFPAELRAETNALCLACHLSRPAGGKMVSLFESETIAFAEFKNIPKIGLDRSRRVGHPFLSHPVADHSDPLRAGETLSCLSCHLPHTAPLPRLLRAEWKGLEVCDRCHDMIKSARTKP